MNRITRIEKAIINQIKGNGGHWIELEMKNGDKLYIQRQNFESFENLEKEKFSLTLNGANKPFLSRINIREVSEYINQNY